MGSSPAAQLSVPELGAGSQHGAQHVGGRAMARGAGAGGGCAPEEPSAPEVPPQQRRKRGRRPRTSILCQVRSTAGIMDR